MVGVVLPLHQQRNLIDRFLHRVVTDVVLGALLGLGGSDLLLQLLGALEGGAQLLAFLGEVGFHALHFFLGQLSAVLGTACAKVLDFLFEFGGSLFRTLGACGLLPVPAALGLQGGIGQDPGAVLAGHADGPRRLLLLGACAVLRCASVPCSVPSVVAASSAVPVASCEVDASCCSVLSSVLDSSPDCSVEVPSSVDVPSVSPLTAFSAASSSSSVMSSGDFDIAFFPRSQ
jgi:hypothetical protein